MKATIPHTLAEEIVVKALTEYKQVLAKDEWHQLDKEHNEKVIKAINIVLKEFK